jgi:hypothetical protein
VICGFKNGFTEDIPGMEKISIEKPKPFITVQPDKRLSFNEWSQHIRNELLKLKGLSK